MISDTKFTMGWPPRADEPVWLTIGNFDGVHLGHQALIQDLIAKAQVDNSKSVLINFWPNPKLFFSKTLGSYLSTRAEKINLLSKLGVDDVVTLPFDHEMANLTPKCFLDKVLKYFNVVGIVVGENFALGKDRQGTPTFLAKLCAKRGLQFKVYPPLIIGKEPVSSSRIRAALATGKVDEANKLLGRPYALCSKVVSGEKVGKSIGVPTANLEIDIDKFLPRRGVYASIAKLRDSVHQAVTNIGVRPTFGNQFNVSVETLILDFDDDIYGEDLRIEFIHWLRPEEKYNHVQDLIKQIEIDKTETRRIFENGFE